MHPDPAPDSRRYLLWKKPDLTPGPLLARLLASHKIGADVFVSITPGPMQILKDAGLIDEAVPVASTSMVVAYSPEASGL